MRKRVKNLELRIKNLSTRIRNWIGGNRLESFLFFLIILGGAFFRLYRIDEYMTFLGDEGRDAIIVRRLLVNLDPILIGPGTSIGNMYLGPLYYYLIAPFLLIFRFNPVGPSVFVALLGVVTIFFVWWVVRIWFPNRQNVEKRSVNWGALVASGLYAVSPVVINFSKSSWNPNIMPFFSLLTIYSVWKFWFEAKLGWIVVAFVSMAFVLQSHYLGLLLFPILGLFLVFSFLNLISGEAFNSKSGTQKEAQIKNFVRYTLIGVGVFFLLMSPLLIFDLRHNFVNFNAMRKFLTERETTVSVLPWKAVPKLPEVVGNSISSLLGAGNVDLTWLYVNGFGFLTLVVFIRELFMKEGNSRLGISFVKGLWRRLNTSLLSPFFLIGVWLAVSYIGLGLYKQHIYDHYFGFFFTAPFILVGGVTQYLFTYLKPYWRYILLGYFIYAFSINLSKNPLKYPPNRQMQKAIEVAEKIRKESQGAKYNLAVIAERNYEDGYQYFLELWGEPVLDIDPLNYESTLGESLFVICELPRQKCDPTHNPKAEIANFGWSKIVGEWDVAGVTLFRLVHSKKTQARFSEGFEPT